MQKGNQRYHESVSAPINGIILRHTVSVTGAGASLCLSAAAGAASGPGVLPWSLPALSVVALVCSFVRVPFTAVPDELAEPDR
jgi:hypothetical protein